MNLGSFNGYAINGSIAGEVKSSAELTGEATVGPLGVGYAYGASVVAGEATITPVQAAVVRGASVAVSCDSTVYLSNVRVIRPIAAAVTGSSSADAGAGKVFSGVQAFSGSAEVISFQGDSSDISGSASVSADAGIGYGSSAAPFGTVTSITADPTIHHGGIYNNGLFGTASVVAEAGIADINGYITYDCVVNLSGSGSIDLPDYPIHRPIFAQIDVGASMTVEMAYKLSVAASIENATATVSANMLVDRYFQAAIVAPRGSVSATASLSTYISAALSGESECFFSSSILFDSHISLTGECGIEAAPGIAYRANSEINGTADLDPLAYAQRAASAAVIGQCDALASMRSNPRAYAAEIRTYTVPPEIRSFTVSEELRQITVKAA